MAATNIYVLKFVHKFLDSWKLHAFLKSSYLQCQHDGLDASNIRYANKGFGKVVFSVYGFVLFMLFLLNITQTYKFQDRE